MVKKNNRKNSKKPGRIKLTDDDSDFDLATEVSKGRPEQFGGNDSVQIDKDAQQAIEAKLADTLPSLTKVQSGRIPLTKAEKQAKYRKKLKGSPSGTPNHEKWLA